MRALILGLLLTLSPRVFSKPLPQKVLLIGFDGSERTAVINLLKQNKLPHLQSIINEGSYVDILVNEAATETKPGWSQVLTGYSSNVTKVFTNKFYEPIPLGYTIFERLKKEFGSNYKTFFVTGKTNNTGARGPHKICINCRNRFPDTHQKTGWWDETQNAPTKKGVKAIYDSRKGEPYFNALKSIDLYKNSLYEAKHVADEGIKLLQKFQNNNFFGFIHFEEPDEQGHLYFEGSKEYKDSIIEADRNLGRVLKEIKNLKLEKQIKIFVTSDHGFDIGQGSHRNAPYIWMVSNVKILKKSGDRRDFTPTVLKLLGFNLSTIKPALNGNPLI
jgi:predicted AlkP superfamily pyrophosphatase or phosphodiesterase